MRIKGTIASRGSFFTAIGMAIASGHIVSME